MQWKKRTWSVSGKERAILIVVQSLSVACISKFFEPDPISHMINYFSLQICQVGDHSPIWFCENADVRHKKPTFVWPFRVICRQETLRTIDRELGNPTAESSERDKRTVGVFRRIFPELSKVSPTRSAASHETYCHTADLADPHLHIRVDLRFAKPRHRLRSVNLGYTTINSSWFGFYSVSFGHGMFHLESGHYDIGESWSNRSFQVPCQLVSLRGENGRAATALEFLRLNPLATFMFFTELTEESFSLVCATQSFLRSLTIAYLLLTKTKSESFKQLFRLIRPWFPVTSN